jgi:predicted AlkP superfamily pyrophosphatase or phosphodiesterase
MLQVFYLSNLPCKNTAFRLMAKFVQIGPFLVHQNCLSHMTRIALVLFFLCFGLVVKAQKNGEEARPRIVVGIMVDQMRWDFLYRYQARYGKDGFARLLREGFNCDNTYIPYAQTVTACGHASVYTGSVPSINGIVGNEWYSREKGQPVYCVEDDSVRVIGGKGEPMSPKNLSVTTVTDELRIATNYRSKVIGIAIKDRGGILPAGHTANAAYWYDASTGNWVSSTYYMQELPVWVNNFNKRKLPDSLLALNWNTLFPKETYLMSDADAKPYEGRNNSFPHETKSFVGKNYGVVSSTPHGNTLTLELARQAVLGEQLGQDEYTDFLAVSLSSPDYIGHQYGPNSIEVEDTYLRLDQELGAFLKFLDERFGKNYTVFLTADHGVAHAAGYAQEHRFPGGQLTLGNTKAAKSLIDKYGFKVIEAVSNNQIFLNRKLIDSAGLKTDEVKSFFLQELNKEPGIHYAFDNEKIMDAHLPEEVRTRYLNGLHPKLGGDIQVIPVSGSLSYPTGSSHGLWYPYDAKIPFVMMGWGIRQGTLHRTVYMSDIAPTIASLLKIQAPSGNVGNAIGEALR